MQALFEAFDENTLALVPARPTRQMVVASMTALHKGFRPSEGTLETPVKHTWRLWRAIGVRPDWRVGRQDDAEVRARGTAKKKMAEAA